MLSFLIYRDVSNQYRWRLRAANGLIIADSAESYHNEQDCRNAIALIRSNAATAEVIEQE